MTARSRTVSGPIRSLRFSPPSTAIPPLASSSSLSSTTSPLTLGSRATWCGWSSLANSATSAGRMTFSRNIFERIGNELSDGERSSR